jgi:hypothetical protein
VHTPIAPCPGVFVQLHRLVHGQNRRLQRIDAVSRFYFDRIVFFYLAIVEIFVNSHEIRQQNDYKYLKMAAMGIQSIGGPTTEGTFASGPMVDAAGAAGRPNGESDGTAFRPGCARYRRVAGGRTLARVCQASEGVAYRMLLAALCFGLVD